jgi:2-iminobutanoate/2-iminopropanoate deaminase
VIMDRQEYRVAQLAEPVSHYTDLVRYGELVFLSGAGPVDAEGRLTGGDDVTAQARQVFENIKAMLEAVGADFHDILKVTVYVADIQDREAINQIRREYFGDSKPASTLIEISRFVVPGMKLEVEAVVGLRSAQ